MASGSSASTAVASISPTSKSSSASPRASIAQPFARRLRTFWAPALLTIVMASPSQANQVGTRCGVPSGRTVDSQTTGSSRRNRSRRAAASSSCMPGRWPPRGPATTGVRQDSVMDV